MLVVGCERGFGEAGRVHTGELGYEERESDTDGGKERALVFLGCEHEDGKHELKGQEHFDKETSHNGGVAAERR